jgi:hypothetical protein
MDGYERKAYGKFESKSNDSFGAEFVVTLVRGPVSWIQDRVAPSANPTVTYSGALRLH